MKEASDLGFDFGKLIDRTARKSHTLLARMFTKNTVDLTPYQWTILNLVAKEGGKSQVEIAGKSSRNTASVSRIIDAMIKKKLITRKVDATDKRGYNIEITKLGKLTWKKAKPIVKEYREIGWTGLDDKDYKIFVRLMTTISNNLKNNN